MDVALITADVAASRPDGLAALVASADRPLIEALERRDARVHRPVWDDDTVDWSGFDLALVRTTWDYTDRREAFVTWAERAAASTRLWNPPVVLRWNSHKSYLLELEERGAPVIPTAWLGQGDRVELGDLLAFRGWSDAVVKPAVGSGSRGMARVAVDDADHRTPAEGAGTLGLAAGQAHLDAALRAGDVLVQPYLPSVGSRGELSVVVVDGQVSHAVRKVPQPGDFRVQTTYGGHYRREDPGPEVASLARWIVDATGAELFIARVDLLEDDLGALQLAELEAIEPDLYLGVAPEVAGRLADAVLRRAALPPARG